jgi:hypothetical protein
MSAAELITALIKEIDAVGGPVVSFDGDPIFIKLTPHSHPVYVYRVKKNDSKVWYMNALTQWVELDPANKMFEYILSSIHARLRVIQMNAKKSQSA